MSTNSSEPGDGEAADGARLVRVGVSDYAVADGAAVLSTSGLGSCLGVALRDPDTDVAGLLHAMLPAAEDAGSDPAKFADTGVPALIAEMEAAGGVPRRMEAKLAGGSRMLDFSGEKGTIGDRNVEAAEAVLGRHDVDVVARDVGGSHGRSIRFEAATGDLHVKTAYEGTAVI